ncbi:MAG: hypothetical protein HYX97_03060 [Chloroflexi bacterium]|nr:hypothetical protein [Chloroflexota bacterium]
MASVAERIPDVVSERVFARSGGRCECARPHTGQQAPHHGGRCLRRFSRFGGHWESRVVSAEAVRRADKVVQCEALCLACAQLLEAESR